MRELERVASQQEAAGLTLMERAGLAAARLAQRLLDADARRPGRRVLVVAGPGNNGGDAFECAVHLRRSFLHVDLVFLGETDRLPADAARAQRKWREAGGSEASEMPAGQNWDLVIDGLFGIGLARPLAGRHAECVARINALGCPVLALDAPSGIDADTGAILGCAVRATHTLSFIALKPGLLTLDGPDHCGELHCDALGLEPAALLAPSGALIDQQVLSERPRRPANFHKGRAGDAGIMGGAEGMIGAALIAARAALAVGAGRVLVGFLAEQGPAVDPLQPELMMRRPAQLPDESSALLAGPGMGTGAGAVKLLRAAIASVQPLVLDADALNLVAANARLMGQLARRKSPSILTPHPAEAARLLGAGTREVQADRIAAAVRLAARSRSLVVLKGNGSVLAEPEGRWWINGSGNAGMASAGMGDALAGMLVALLAQGMAPLAALQLGTWMHGAAGDALAATGDGPLGITASQVIAEARRILNRQPVAHLV
jgi:hydroxyethylthiazole kinase-like uncharacterized protein yjeF